MQLSAHDRQPGIVKYSEFLLKHRAQVLIFMISMCEPVSKKSTDEVFGILRHLYIIWEDECVLVVHDLPISSNQGLGIEGGFTCEKSTMTDF